MEISGNGTCFGNPLLHFEISHAHPPTSRQEMAVKDQPRSPQVVSKLKRHENVSTLPICRDYKHSIEWKPPRGNLPVILKARGPNPVGFCKPGPVTFNGSTSSSTVWLSWRWKTQPPCFTSTSTPSGTATARPHTSMTSPYPKL